MTGLLTTEVHSLTKNIGAGLVELIHSAHAHIGPDPRRAAKFKIERFSQIKYYVKLATRLIAE